MKYTLNFTTPQTIGVASVAVEGCWIKSNTCRDWLRAKCVLYFFSKSGYRKDPIQVWFEWRSFDTTCYWVISVDTIKVSSTDTQPNQTGSLTGPVFLDRSQSVLPPLIHSQTPDLGEETRESTHHGSWGHVPLTEDVLFDQQPLTFPLWAFKVSLQCGRWILRKPHSNNASNSSLMSGWWPKRKQQRNDLSIGPTFSIKLFSDHLFVSWW